MLSCQEASRLLSMRQDQKLGAAEVLGLRLHLMLCDGCRNLDRQFMWLRRASRAYRAGAAPAGSPIATDVSTDGAANKERR